MHYYFQREGRGTGTIVGMLCPLSNVKETFIPGT